MAYHVRSVIIADETRFEMNGREIIIGVYNDGMIFGTFPAIIEKLFVRIAVMVDSATYKNYQMHMVSNNGRVIFSQGGQIVTPIDIEIPVLFGFNVRPIAFPSPEKINIEFGLDEPAKLVSSFIVRMPRDLQEQARVQTPQVG